MRVGIPQHHFRGSYEAHSPATRQRNTIKKGGGSCLFSLSLFKHTFSVFFRVETLRPDPPLRVVVVSFFLCGHRGAARRAPEGPYRRRSGGPERACPQPFPYSLISAVERRENGAAHSINVKWGLKARNLLALQARLPSSHS